MHQSNSQLRRVRHIVRREIGVDHNGQGMRSREGALEGGLAFTAGVVGFDADTGNCHPCADEVMLLLWNEPRWRWQWIRGGS